MSRRIFSLRTLAAVLTFAAGIARAQERDVSPTPAAAPPAATPSPAPPPEATPVPLTTPVAAPSSAVPPAAATPAPTAAVVTPAPPPAMRITDSAVVAILQAPAEN